MTLKANQIQSRFTRIRNSAVGNTATKTTRYTYSRAGQIGILQLLRLEYEL